MRWIMLEAPFTAGVTIDSFYAMQPYLLELYGKQQVYAIAGLPAASVAGAQIAISLLVLWGLTFAAITPVRQAYLNALIESRVRATVLSFDSLPGSASAAAAQPILGKAADVWSYLRPASSARGSRRFPSRSYCWLDGSERRWM